MKTILSITGSTCSGKTHLTSVLKERGFKQLVSTTTRLPRVGEVEGIDYNFITHEQSALIEEAEHYVELNSFNGERYGVTLEEVVEKLSSSSLPVMVILTPEGVERYQEFCDESDIKLVKMFVATPQDIMLERLKTRAEKEISYSLQGFVGQVVDDSLREKMSKHLSIMLTRTRNILIEEKKWQNWSCSWKYDIIVPGDDIDSAVSTVSNFKF